MKLKLYEFLYFFDDGEQLVCVLTNNGGRYNAPITVEKLRNKEIWNEIADKYVSASYSSNDVIYIILKK